MVREFDGANYNYSVGVKFYDIYRYSTIRGYADEASRPVKLGCNVDVVSLIEFFQSMLGGEDVKQRINMRRKEIYLKSVEDFGAYYVLLVNITDAASEHTASRNIETDQTTSVIYDDNEGTNRSSHIVIRKEANGDGRNLMAFQVTQGLDRAKLVSFFNSLIANYVRLNRNSFLVPDPESEADENGNIKQKVQKPKIELHGYIADKFFSDMENGCLDQMVLVGDPQRVRNVGESVPDFFQHLRIDIDVAAAERMGLRDLFNAVVSGGREFNMSTLRVKFRDESDAGHSKDVSLDGMASIDDENYVLTRKIYFGFRRVAAYDEVSEVVAGKMIEKIEDERI
ncbi:hypothetical protein [Salinicola aestuarinus]|uniref:hypothetical protein n=1 Tax=Salinicola aestuarinus TaxID=1949082 RepID=UPI00130027FE|nr:hypothetical protein [Salinicola aestuarinus]